MKIRHPSILLLNIAGLALLLFWYVPVGHGFWFSLDTGVLRFFNHKLIESPLFLWIAAITNNRVFDGCPLLVVGALMLHFWLKETLGGCRRIVVIGLVMSLAAVVLNRLGQVLIPVKHASPTLILDNIYRVSELLYVLTRDASKDSLPGDHGMTLLIFSTFMLRYFGKVVGIIGLIIAMVSAFPCIMIGAHWFTDIAVGSMMMVLIGPSWWPMTSLSDRLVTLFVNYLPGKNKQLLNK